MSDGWGTRRARELTATFRADCEEKNSPCWLCLQPIDYAAPGGTTNAFELDHALPRAEYPELALEPDNFRAAHSGCNRSRGKRDAPAILGPTTIEW